MSESENIARIQLKEKELISKYKKAIFSFGDTVGILHYSSSHILWNNLRDELGIISGIRLGDTKYQYFVNGEWFFEDTLIKINI